MAKGEYLPALGCGALFDAVEVSDDVGGVQQQSVGIPRELSLAVGQVDTAIQPLQSYWGAKGPLGLSESVNGCRSLVLLCHLTVCQWKIQPNIYPQSPPIAVHSEIVIFVT